MNPLLSTSFEVRLAVMFVLGACIGSAVNLAIYRLAWCPRAISPWSRPDANASPRRRWDRLPIVGWLGLRREASLHGAGFWIRPMLLELLAGLGLAWLYWWEIGVGGLLPAEMPRPPIAMLLTALHLEFAAHTLLIAFMLVASMIDIDEKIIPDEVTIPGTLIGLLIVAAWPFSLLPETRPLAAGQLGVRFLFLDLTSPNAWPLWLTGCPRVGSLALGVGCWWLWCAALLPRSWYSRHGWRRAMQLCWTRVVREPSTYRIVRMALVGVVAIAMIWFQSGPSWRGLLSALVGMAAGGGLVWLVRIIGTAVLRREAMGFGDVTLMAMIGAFLGWQPCLVVFFLAPFAGLVVGILRLILFRDREIPYGPFLCLAALAVIIGWPTVWDHTQEVFGQGWLVPLAMLVCLMLMAVMLATWRLILSAFR